MPKVTRWFIKAGIIYFTAGIFLALIAEIPTINSGPLLLPVYWHMLVMGWITQLIMGVSIWMFPRKYRDKEKREFILTWLAFWLLNSGLVLRFFSEPFLPFFRESSVISFIVVISAVLQVSAIIAYILEIWPRLQSREKRKRSRSS
ncbi:hypothetical protein BH23BAC3_BH23BAC3_35460 [soil metagenome]